MLSGIDTEQLRRVGEIYLVQNPFRQAEPVDSPAALRRRGRRRVIEVLILTFEEAKVDLVELVAENLLWRLEAAWDGVRAEQDAILILVEKLARCARLASELADARGNVDVQVGITIEALGDEGEILRVAAHVQSDELRVRVAFDHAIARRQQFGVGREVAVVERPVGVV